MKILLVSSFLPYPLFSGGHIRLYNLMKNLSKNNEITLVCEKRSYQTESDVKKIQDICKKFVVVPRKNQWTVENIVKSIFSAKPFLIVGHTNPELRKAIDKELILNKFDLIHVETFYVMQNLPEVSTPVVLAEHNVEYLIYKRYADKANILIRPLLYYDVLKLRRIERYFWKKADKLIAVSKKEKNIMGISNVSVIPNGADMDKFAMKDLSRESFKKLLFIGDFVYIQNQNAVKWILSEIWPSLIKKMPSLTLWVVGKRIPISIKKMKMKGVVFDENAPAQTELIYKSASILVAPIQVGGGTSLKIIESMASGLPVVTTSLGNEGIDAKDGVEIMIAETGEEFTNRVLELLENREKYDEIATNGRKFIQKNFDWKNISLKLEKIYKEVIS